MMIGGLVSMQVKWHISHLEPHTTPHTPHLTPHTPHLTPHTSLLAPHTSHLTPHTGATIILDPQLLNSVLARIECDATAAQYDDDVQHVDQHQQQQQSLGDRLALAPAAHVDWHALNHKLSRDLGLHVALNSRSAHIVVQSLKRFLHTFFVTI
jgi:hypothetical protein